jgi:nucleoid-associated protein YgaU
MSRFLAIIVLLALLSSCAKPPIQKLDAAEYMLKRAQLLQAGEFAPTEFQAAYTALSDAKRSIEKTDYRDADDSLDFSLQHSRRAIKLTEEGKTRRAREEAARRRAEEQARQEAIRDAEEAKRKAVQARKVIVKTAPKPKPKIEPVDNYDVGEGETLWTISAQPEVYNEGLLWPLLYQANRDQIKDPRQIFPGQTLSIRRDMTSEELEDARQKARESDIFPVPQATDTPQ